MKRRTIGAAVEGDLLTINNPGWRLTEERAALRQRLFRAGSVHDAASVSAGLGVGS